MMAGLNQIEIEGMEDHRDLMRTVEMAKVLSKRTIIS
jgi:hypothetical protein